jgi:tetratricopeptide (TPR) repeat protein
MRMEPEFHTPITFSFSSLRKVHIAIVALVLSAAAVGVRAQMTSGEDLKQQIHQFEGLAARAEHSATTPIVAGRLLAHLGQLYEDAGMYSQSETAFTKAIRLLRSAPDADADLANAIDGLGGQYMMRGDTMQAELSEQKALAIRQAKGLTADLPWSWYHLAALALREREFEKARDYAERVLAQASPSAGDDSTVQAGARFALGMALCRLHRGQESVAVMETAMNLVRQSHKPDDFVTGLGSFYLGYAYWKSGDKERAGELLKSGAEVIQKQVGWGNPICLTAMEQYHSYLEETHRKEEARAMEGELKKALEAAGIRQGQGDLDVAALF